MDISDAPPVVTAEERAKKAAEERVKEAEERAERKKSILDKLHPGQSGAAATAPAALDAQMRETVTTIAERSGLDAAAIAAMLSLDVEAVRAVLAPNGAE